MQISRKAVELTAPDEQEHSPADIADHAARSGRKPLVTPAFGLAWLVNFCQYLAFYILVTTMALYAVKQFAASDAASGLASSAFVVGATLARVFAGYLVDTFGQRKTLLVSLIVVVIACGLYLPAGSLVLLIAVRMLHGIGYAFASTATMALAQSVIPRATRGGHRLLRPGIHAGYRRRPGDRPPTGQRLQLRHAFLDGAGHGHRGPTARPPAASLHPPARTERRPHQDEARRTKKHQEAGLLPAQHRTPRRGADRRLHAGRRPVLRRSHHLPERLL